jgi:hypothetical protein
MDKTCELCGHPSCENTYGCTHHADDCPWYDTDPETPCVTRLESVTWIPWPDSDTP